MKHLHDDFFGDFSYDDTLESWCTLFKDHGAEIWVTISNESDLPVAKKFYQEQAQWELEAKGLVTSCILKESAKGMDRIPTATECMDLVFLESMGIYDEGDSDYFISMSYDDGKLLGGHIITVTGTLKISDTQELIINFDEDAFMGG